MKGSKKALVLFYFLMILIGSYFIFRHLYSKSAVRAFGPLNFTFPGSPLFKEDNWFPGESLTKTISVENTDSFPQLVAIKPANFTNGLGDSITIEIVVQGVPIYQKSLSDFFRENSIKLFSLNGHEQQSFDITLTMSEEAGDEFQGKTASFDLAAGVETSTLDRIPSIRPFPTIKVIPTIPSIPQIRLRSSP